MMMDERSLDTTDDVRFLSRVELGIAATSSGGGFFGGIVIGYTLKKVAKVIAIFYHLFGRNKQSSILTGL